MDYDKQIITALNHPEGKRRDALWQEILDYAVSKKDFNTLARVASIRLEAPDPVRISAGLSAIEIAVNDGDWKTVSDLCYCWDLHDAVKRIALDRTPEAAINHVKNLVKKKEHMELQRLLGNVLFPEEAKREIRAFLSKAALEIDLETERKSQGFRKRAKEKFLRAKELVKRVLRPIQSS